VSLSQYLNFNSKFIKFNQLAGIKIKGGHVMNKSILKVVGSLIILSLLFVGCDTPVISEGESPSKSAIEPAKTTLGSVADNEVKKSLTKVKSATAHYHDVDKAEADGYVQASPFVPGMGYHYANFSLVDGNIDPLQPEVLVYQDNPQHEDKRKLGAVEYVIPSSIIDEESQSELDGKFPGIDGDKWHYEKEVHGWTLHAWIWVDNPKGVFHPTNPDVQS
jgi:hypothetical protein